MDLFVLAVADQVTDGGQMRQLANGWMGWESKTLRRARGLGAQTLVALAARLDAAALLALQNTTALPAPPRA